MIKVRKSGDRGHVRLDWLESYHTFSFDTYYDPEHMGFRSLRVINEDWVQAGAGFPLHPHRDMEILTFIVSGALQHEDDHGGRAVIRAGEVQRITAGRGIRHSEANPSPTDVVHLLQIWIFPDRQGLDPGYQTAPGTAAAGGKLRCVAAGDGRHAELSLHQDAAVFAGALEAGDRWQQPLDVGRHAWVQVITGTLEVNGTPLQAGDGAAVSEETRLDLQAGEAASFLLFDLA